MSFIFTRMMARFAILLFFNVKNLAMSEICCTFAAENQEKQINNCFIGLQNKIKNKHG